MAKPKRGKKPQSPPKYDTLTLRRMEKINSLRQRLRSLAGDASKSSEKSRTVRGYLSMLLPHGSLTVFAPAGTGLRVRCPQCQSAPPPEIPQWNRWRWLSAHIAIEHAVTGGGFKVDERTRPHLVGEPERIPAA